MTIIFETKRLIVKAPDYDDRENLFLLQSDPNVMRFIGKGLPRTKEEVDASLNEIINYYNKHGFGFFSVYLKETNEFVGQGGLFHLNFNDASDEIEIGYRLNTKFWHLGIATELARRLIKWGFDNLEISKLVAVIKPENERSRNVMQKIGMCYIGKTKYAGFDVDKFEIAKNRIDFSKIKLVSAPIEEYPVIQNLARFYVYDMSEYLGHEEGWEIPKNGLYECIDFKKYWQNDGTFPFLVKYDEELVGFVIVDKKGSSQQVDFNMAQFFILRKFKNQGIGRYVAHQCFDQFRGSWEVMVIPGNEGAYRFWRKIISDYTNGNFIEYTKVVAHLKSNPKNIFNFNSKSNAERDVV